MSLGTYGQTIPINIANSDIPSMVDIYYTYNATRSYDVVSNQVFKKLNSSILTQAVRDTNNGEADNIVEGMYNLQLPVSEFNKKGFYTVYIKPKEIECTILDVSVLTAYPDIMGIVLNTDEITDLVHQVKAKTSNGLVGYRVVYLSGSGKRESYHRIVTSNNLAEPVIQAPNSSSDKSYTYRYEESSSYVFLTLSPSSAPSFKANTRPYIGKPTQRILLVNTAFEPITLEIEMTTHDADTISYMLENSQLRDLDNGLITTFNDNDEIYSQSEHYTLKDTMTGNPVYEVKKKRNENIDFAQTISDK